MPARIQAVVEGHRIFLCRENKSPLAELLSDSRRKRLRASPPSTHANDLRWHHRKAHRIHELFFLALGLQSIPEPAGVSVERAGSHVADVPHIGSRREPRLAEMQMRSWCDDPRDMRTTKLN